MAGSPTSDVNRAANAERDIATSLASDSTVPWMGGIAMHERKSATNLPVLERAEPSGLRSRILCHPRADRLDDEDVGEASHNRLAAGTHVLRFNRHQAERALDRFQLWGRRRSSAGMQSFAQWINLRQLNLHGCSEYAPGSHVRPRTVDERAAIGDVRALFQPVWQPIVESLAPPSLLKGDSQNEGTENRRSGRPRDGRQPRYEPSLPMPAVVYASTRLWILRRRGFSKLFLDPQQKMR